MSPVLGRRPIVVLGGMGPQASLRFQQLLIDKSRRYHHGANDDYPYIVHVSLPVPDFLGDSSKCKTAVRALLDLTSTVRQLQPCTIALVCNTAHLLVSEAPLLQQQTFVSMIKIVASALARDGVKRPGLLASPVTVQTGLYQQACDARQLTLVQPTDQQQQRTEQIIRNIIAGSAHLPEQTALHELATQLKTQGAQALVLGCTELPLLFPKEQSPLPVYDCLDLYAEAVIARYYLYNKE